MGQVNRSRSIPPRERSRTYRARKASMVKALVRQREIFALTGAFLLLGIHLGNCDKIGQKGIMVFLKTSWTQHSEAKMRQYGLSKTKLLNILHKPERKEIGIAPGTMAVMRTNPTPLKLRGASQKVSKWGNPKKAAGEVWLMYKENKTERKIISAWRYPGVSKPGEEIPIPPDIREELLESFKDKLHAN